MQRAQRSGYSECSNCSGAQETLLLSLAKSKLEQIAKASTSLAAAAQDPESALTLELPPKGQESIMRSDFTNTVKMRKKSLEDSCAREKSKAKPHNKPACESKLKVSQLKDRFQTHPTPVAAPAASAAKSSKTPLACEPFKIAKVASVGRLSRSSYREDTQTVLN